MKINRNSAYSAGVLFIIATVASIIGLLLYHPILNDPAYIIKSTPHETQVLWGAFFEIITAFAVIGTPLALFPVLKKYNESMALACIIFRLLEATIIIIGIMSLLAIVTLNHEFSTEINPDTASYLINGKLLLAIHNWTFLFGPNVALGPSTLMTSYLLYKSKLIPRAIAVLGLVGGPLIFASGLLVLFGSFLQISFWGFMLAIPVFLYEMSLAIWLLVKGFNLIVVDPVTVLR
jgi:Domain of unknown function (DUF4386)